MNQRQTKEYYQQHSSARWAALIAMCIGSFLTPLALSSVHIATPAIAAALNANAIWLSLIPTAFILSNVITILPAGRIADIWGRKRVYTLGVTLLGLSSLFAFCAPTIEWLVAARLLQGAASSMVFACTLSIISSVFSQGQRGMALGYATASVYLGMSGGPLIGGWFTEMFGWRSVFIFPLPLVVIALLLVSTKLRGEWFGAPDQKLDYLGSALFGVGALSLFASISQLPSIDSVFFLLVCIISLSLFVKQQDQAAFPLVRLRRLWKNKLFSSALMTSALMHGASYSLIFLLSLYLQYIHGMSATATGQLMMIQALSIAIVAPLAGRLADSCEPGLVASCGCLLAILGFAVLQWVGFDSPIYLVPIGLLIIGLGFGLFSTPNNSSAMGAVPEDRLGVAASLLGLARVTGNMLGTAVLLLMMQRYIGDQNIEEAQFPALLVVTKISMAFSLLLAIGGAYFSFNRNKQATMNT